MILIRRLAILMLLFPLSARAEMPTWPAPIDYLTVEDRLLTSYVWDGRFIALNGDNYDMAHLYRSQGPELNIKMGLNILSGKTWQISVPLHADMGYRADLYEATPYIGFGLSGRWQKSDQVQVGFRLDDALQWGGDVQERACHDGFRRAFHCGTGLPWSDAGPHLRRRHVSTYGQVNLLLRF